MFARELNGWTQRDVVSQLSELDHGITAPALSQLENGRTRPASTTLMALCELYGCPPEFFLGRPGDEEHSGFFRSLKAASSRERKQYIARARLLRDFIQEIEGHILLPDVNVPTFETDPEDLDSAEDIAAAVRSRWNIPAGPIDNVVRTLERQGVVVVRSRRFKNEIDAFSVHYPDRPIIVLSIGDTVSTRSRFDAAHELGHLVMHRDEHAGTKAAEQHAHRFAAAFLMPADDIIAELPTKVDMQRLVDLKVKWRVSMQALLVRAKTLGVMSPERYVSAMKLFSSRGWRKAEPGDHLIGAIEAPRLIEAALEALSTQEITVRDLCKAGSLPYDQVHEILTRTKETRPRLHL